MKTFTERAGLTFGDNCQETQSGVIGKYFIGMEELLRPISRFSDCNMWRGAAVSLSLSLSPESNLG